MTMSTMLSSLTIIETNKLPQVDKDLRDEVDKKTRAALLITKDL